MRLRAWVKVDDQQIIKMFEKASEWSSQKSSASWKQHCFLNSPVSHDGVQKMLFYQLIVTVTVSKKSHSRKAGTY